VTDTGLPCDGAIRFGTPLLQRIVDVERGRH